MSNTQTYGGGICPIHNKPYMPAGWPDHMPAVGEEIASWSCPDCAATEVAETREAIQAFVEMEAAKAPKLLTPPDLIVTIETSWQREGEEAYGKENAIYFAIGFYFYWGAHGGKLDLKD